MTNQEVFVSARTSGAVQKRSSTAEAGAEAGPRRVLRRIGGEKSTTRALLLDAAERLMLKEGYAAVTSRKIAAEAKVTSQLVHYYFSTMDELFLALWRRFVVRNMEQHAAALTEPNALNEIWRFNAGTALELEFIALARHRKALQQEIARDGDRFRSMQIEALARVMGDYGLDVDDGLAEVLTLLLQSVSRSMIMEKDLGVSVAHAKTSAFIEKWIGQLGAVQRQTIAKRNAQ
jgi:AcrR family transcriptional regulator